MKVSTHWIKLCVISLSAIGLFIAERSSVSASAADPLLEPMFAPDAILDFVSAAVSGGDGDGIIEPNECNVLTMTIKNNGTSTASGIIGVLSTSTPGVTVTQPVSEFPDLLPGDSGTNGVPFRISTSPSFVCGTPIALTLALTYSGGSKMNNFTLATCACPSQNLTGSLTAGDPTQTSRLFRDGVASTCGSSKSCSTIPGTFHYDAQTFTNGPAPACVTVDVSTACAGANFIFAGAYAGSFNPASICTNFIADIGISPLPNASMSFNLAANQSFTVVVSEVTANAGCPQYQVTVSGLSNCADVGVGGGVCASGCVHGQGYWKNHEEAWPVTGLNLGTVSYTKAQLLSILSQPVRGNGLVSLAHQLIAARLNLAAGAAATPAVLNAINSANALIGSLVVPPGGNGSLAPAATSGLVITLDDYVSGIGGGPLACP